MMVMMIARTPSLNASSLPLVMEEVGRLCAALVFGLAVGDGFGEPEEFVEECRRALFVSSVIRSAVVLEAVAHTRYGQTFWNGKCAHADGHEAQLREASQT